MHRLTKIDRYGHYYTNNANCRNIHSKDGENIEGVYFKGGVLAIDGEAIKKLGRLEDLEEELGCPLDLLIRGAIDSHELDDNHQFVQTIITYNPYGKLIEGYEMEIYGEYISITVDGKDNYNDYDLETITLKIKDYLKTWWFKGDKDE